MFEFLYQKYVDILDTFEVLGLGYKFAEKYIHLGTAKLR